jgi:TetR/AcrR family transcriptional regulator
MGIAERREREKRGRHDLAISAAMELYNEEGYHAITMEKIAERSELSRAALYIYFKTKDEIFISAIVNHMAYFEEILQQVYDNRESIGKNLLENMWACFRTFYQTDPVLFNASLYFHQSEIIRNLSEELRVRLYESGSRVVRLQHQIMKYGVNKGIFIQCNPMTLSEVIWSCFLGITQLENSKQVVSGKNHLDMTQDLAIKILRKSIINKAGPHQRRGTQH